MAELTFMDEVAVLLGEHQANPDNEKAKEDYIQCRDMLLRFKAKQGTTLEQLETQLGERLVSAADKLKKAAEAQKRNAENEAKAGIIAKVEASANADEARALLSEVEAFGERFVITLTAEGFSTNLKVAARGGNTGSGRPGKDSHSGYAVASTGQAIMGGFNTWVKTQLEANAFSDETVAKLHGPQNGKLNAKAKTSKVLLSEGIVIAVDTTEDSEVEAS